MDFYGTNIKNDVGVDADNQYDIGEIAKRIKVVYAVTFEGESSSAQWGDLAEYYTCKNGGVGSVMCVSPNDDYDLEECFEELSQSSVGVISAAPGYVMNRSLDGGLAVGLVGRLPVKIRGKIKKSDFIVCDTDGCARAGVDGEEQYSIGICNKTKDTDEIALVECIIN